jgi:hypothetical protein
MPMPSLAGREADGAIVNTRRSIEPMVVSVPKLDTDETYVRFVADSPEGALVFFVRQRRWG